MSEAREQKHVVDWLRMHKHLVAHIPNGGKRGVIEAKRLKDAGVLPGMPDLLIFDPPRKNNPNNRWHSMAIEMKDRDKGTTSANQKEVLISLSERGWLCVVCHGADEAIRVLESFGYGIRRRS